MEHTNFTWRGVLRLMHPVVMQNDLTQHNVVASSRGWALSLQDDEVWNKHKNVADVWVDVTTSDGAPVNKTTFEHECGRARRLGGSRIIKSRKKCNVHMMNRCFKRSWGKQRFTSRNFSFFRLVQQSTKLNQINRAMDAVIMAEAQIFPELEPPPEHKARHEQLIDM